MIQRFLDQLLDRRDLTHAEALEAMNSIMLGEATQAQIAGFLDRAAGQGRDRRRDRRLCRGDARPRRVGATKA